MDGKAKPRGRAGSPRSQPGEANLSQQARDMIRAFEIDLWPAGIVYFVRGVRVPMFKIGYSEQRHFVDRLAKLIATNADELVLEAVLHGDHEVEQRFHLQLDQWRARAEWFRLDPPMRRMLHVLHKRSFAKDRDAEVNASEVEALVRSCLTKRADPWVAEATDFLWRRMLHENSERRLREEQRSQDIGRSLRLRLIA